MPAAGGCSNRVATSPPRDDLYPTCTTRSPQLTATLLLLHTSCRGFGSEGPPVQIRPPRPRRRLGSPRSYTADDVPCVVAPRPPSGHEAYLRRVLRTGEPGRGRPRRAARTAPARVRPGRGRTDRDVGPAGRRRWSGRPSGPLPSPWRGPEAEGRRAGHRARPSRQGRRATDAVHEQTGAVRPARRVTGLDDQESALRVVDPATAVEEPDPVAGDAEAGHTVQRLAAVDGAAQPLVAPRPVAVEALRHREEHVVAEEVAGPLRVVALVLRRGDGAAGTVAGGGRTRPGRDTALRGDRPRPRCGQAPSSGPPRRRSRCRSSASTAARSSSCLLRAPE
jgi:hypothetical protein